METRLGELVCPDCGAVLRQIDDRKGKEAWTCPTALDRKTRKLFFGPSADHLDCWVYTSEDLPRLQRRAK